MLAFFNRLLVGCATQVPTKHTSSIQEARTVAQKRVLESKLIEVAWHPYHNDFRWFLGRAGYRAQDPSYEVLGCSKYSRPPCWVHQGRGGSSGTAFSAYPVAGTPPWINDFLFELMDWKKGTDVEIKVTVGGEVWFHGRSFGRDKMREWEIYKKDLRVRMESDRSFVFNPFRGRK